MWLFKKLKFIYLFYLDFTIASFRFLFLFLDRMLQFRHRFDRHWPGPAWPMHCVRLLPVHNGSLGTSAAQSGAPGGRNATGLFPATAQRCRAQRSSRAHRQMFLKMERKPQKSRTKVGLLAKSKWSIWYMRMYKIQTSRLERLGLSSLCYWSTNKMSHLKHNLGALFKNRLLVVFTFAFKKKFFLFDRFCPQTLK